MKRKNLSTFIIFCILFAAFLAFPVENNAQNKKDIRKAQKLTAEGNKSFLTKDYRQAIDKYAEAVVLSPNYAEAHFWKGYAHYYLNEYDQALTEINLAAEQNYNKPLEIYKVRWFLNYNKKNYDAALDDAQKGLQLAPDDITMTMALGDIYRAQNKYQEALAAYKKAAQLNPASGDIQYLIAVSQQNTGDAEGQQTNAAEAIKKGTKYVGEAYYLIADAHHKARKYPEALVAYKQSLASKDNIYEVYRGMADIYRIQSRYSDAIEISNRGLKMFPNDGKIYTDLSWYYSLANKHGDAIDAAQKAISLLPEQSLAYTNLCRAHNDLKQYQLAITSCNKALQIAPNDGETNFYIGFAYTASNKPDEAAKYYPKAVAGLEEFTKNNPDYSDGFYLLGNAYTSNSEFDKAVESYKKSLDLSPRFAKARYNLGSIYKYLKKDDLAAAEYNALLEVDPGLAAKLKDVIDKKN